MPPPANGKQTLAVLGGQGMLGADLAMFLAPAYDVTPIDRDNYDECRGRSFDVFVNANGNSKRFWANEHPFEDFIASTESVYRSIADFSFGTYVYISSSDVYPDHDRSERTREDERIDPARLSPYGFHKHLSELVVKHRAPEHHILRSSLILGSQLKKGPFYDILHGKPLFITRASELQAVTTVAVSEAIQAVLRSGQKNEIWNVGGRGRFSFAGVDRYVTTRVEFSDQAETQIYEMDVWKLASLYPLKTSDEYVSEYFAALKDAVTS